MNKLGWLLAACTALLSPAALAADANTEAHWGINRTANPNTLCLYDNANNCQPVALLPQAGGAVGLLGGNIPGQFNFTAAGRQLTLGTHGAGINSSTPDVSLMAWSDENWLVPAGTFAGIVSVIDNMGAPATGERSALAVTLQSSSTAVPVGTNLVASGFTSHGLAGSGTWFGENAVAWCDTGVTSSASCVAGEDDVQADTNVSSKVGRQIVDTSRSKLTGGNNLDIGLLIGAQSTAPGFRDGIKFGYTVGSTTLASVRPDGNLISTGNLGTIAAGFNLSNLAGFTYAALIVPDGAVALMWDTAGSGGKIDSATGSNGGELQAIAHGWRIMDGATEAVHLANDATGLRFIGGTFSAPNASGSFGGTLTVGGAITGGNGLSITGSATLSQSLTMQGSTLSAPNASASFGGTLSTGGTVTVGNGLVAAALPTTGGTVKGSLCVDGTGVVYVKTTTGACK